MTPLEEAIGHTFSDRTLLARALTRLAYAHEQGLPGDCHMDALAVLGDAAIELAVILEIVDAGWSDKGVITKKKINLVNMLRLRTAAESLDLVQYVRWGKGEEAQEIWQSGRVLAECFEALIGALYLDCGMAAVKTLLISSGFAVITKD